MLLCICLSNRFSSRRQRFDHAFLRAKLKNAKSYKRIAGYFRSSIFELVGEELAAIPQVRIVCNSELDTVELAKTLTPEPIAVYAGTDKSRIYRGIEVSSVEREEIKLAQSGLSRHPG